MASTLGRLPLIGSLEGPWSKENANTSFTSHPLATHRSLTSPGYVGKSNNTNKIFPNSGHFHFLWKHNRVKFYLGHLFFTGGTCLDHNFGELGRFWDLGSSACLVLECQFPKIESYYQKMMKRKVIFSQSHDDSMITKCTQFLIIVITSAMIALGLHND